MTVFLRGDGPWDLSTAVIESLHCLTLHIVQAACPDPPNGKGCVPDPAFLTSMASRSNSCSFAQWGWGEFRSPCLKTEQPRSGMLLMQPKGTFKSMLPSWGPGSGPRKMLGTLCYGEEVGVGCPVEVADAMGGKICLCHMASAITFRLTLLKSPYGSGHLPVLVLAVQDETQ